VIMSISSVYIGIDVACAVGKRLPICIVSGHHPFTPLVIPKHLSALLPRGVGNKEITAILPFREAASTVVSTINRIASDMGWKIEHIALDAPAQPPTRRRAFGDPCRSDDAICVPS
jgi:hypothetical protein